MKFNSQICTTREQPLRLLSLGLKKETADMVWLNHALTEDYDDWRSEPIYKDWEGWQKDDIPAWSLGRLIKLMPRTIVMHFPTGEAPDTPIEREVYAQGILISDDSIAETVLTIEWLIKEGYFNKEYLV